MPEPSASTDDGWEFFGTLANQTSAAAGGPLPDAAAGGAATADASSGDGWEYFGTLKKQQAQPTEGGLSVLGEAADMALAVASGVTSGVEVGGALLEAAVPFFPELGEAIRQAGVSGTEFLTSHWSPEYKAAAEKSWATLNTEEAAYLDKRSWAIGILQQIPYMVGTLGAGTVAGGAVRAATGISEAAARKAGVVGVAGAAGAGEAAAGVGRAADAAGLSMDEKVAGMRTALPFGGAAGAVLGGAVEKLTGGALGKGIAKRFAIGAAGEAIEESGTQFGTEVGKADVGLEFDTGAIGEAGVAGALLGGATGTALGKYADRRVRLAKEALDRRNAANLAANTAEQQAIDVEADKQRRAAAPLALPAPAEGVDTTPPPPPVAQAGASLSAATVAAPREGPNSGTVYDSQIKEVEAKLDQLRAKLAETTDKKQRAKAVSKFRVAKQQLDQLSGLRDDLLAKRAKANQTPQMPAVDLSGTAREGASVAGPSYATETVTTPPQQQQLFEHLPLQGPPPTTQQRVDDEELGRLLDQLEEPAGFPEPDMRVDNRPIIAKINLSIKRSQAAKLGAETKRAKRRGPLPGPASKPIASSVSAEATAILARDGAAAKPRQTPLQAEAVQPPVSPAEGPSAPPPEAAQAPAAAAPAEPAAPAPPQQETSTAPAASPVAPAPAAPVRRSGVVNAPSTKPLSPPRPPLDKPPPGMSNAVGAAAPAGLETPAAPETPSSVEPAAPAAPQPATKPVKKPLAKMTPDERLTRVLADGPQPVDTVLAALQDAYGGERNQTTMALIAALRRAFPAGRNRPNPTMVRDARLSNGFQGLYDPKTNAVLVDLQRAEDPVTAVLHEIVHAATVYKMRSNKVYRQQIEAILNDAREMWDNLGWDPAEAEAAFRSPEEFIAEALTNTAFADKLAALPAATARRDMGVLRQLMNHLAATFGMRTSPKTYDLFQQLMEFIPDGSFLADGDIEEMRAKLNELGLSPVASLTSLYRSLLRQHAAATAVPQGVPATDRDRDRVWWRVLPVMSVEQIARSYGAVGRYYTDVTGQAQPLQHDVVNEYYRLISARHAHAAAARIVPSQIADYFKNSADPVTGHQPLNDVLHDARMWALDPSEPVTAPINTYGINLPEGPELYRELEKRYKALNPQQRNAFKMVRDHYAASHADAINQMMLATIRAMVPGPAGARVAKFLDEATRTANVDHDKIKISWQRPMGLADITAQVGGMGLAAKRQQEVIDALMNVHDTLMPAEGPYIPLRRHGDYFVILRSPSVTRRHSRAYLAKLIADDRIKGGSMNIQSRRTLPTGEIEVTYRHEIVTTHDSEAAADKALAEGEAQFHKDGITIETSRRAVRKQVLHEGVGLQSASLERMKESLRQTMAPAAAEMAIEQITKFYLERLPDTSAKKAQLKARRVSGADRDMLSVFAASAQGTSYFSAQMRYGHQLAKTLGPDLQADLETLRAARARNQADDLSKLGEALQKQNNAHTSIATKDISGQQGTAQMLWARAPAVAGAWMLTGLGTIITNAGQVTMLTLPHLAARHGLPSTIQAISGAYRDLMGPTTVETGREIGRAAKSVYGVLKGRPARSFKDPQAPFFRAAAKNLSTTEKAFLEELVKTGKLDHGQIADLQSLGRRQGKFWNAVTYVSEAAFLVPQAVETLNRSVTALASYRLNLKANPALTIEQAAMVAARDIDQTQFNYAQANKASALQNDALRAATVFKTYPIHMWYTITHNAMASFKAETAAERRIAQRTLAGITATTMLASGLMGVMAFEPIYWAAVAIMSAFSDDDDPEQVLRRAMSDWNDELVGMLLKGPIHGLGLADTSRMAIPQLLPVADMKRAATEETGTGEWLALLGEALVGAPGGLIEQQAKGLYQLTQGNFDQARVLMTPKAFQLNDLARVWQYADEGVKNAAGYTMLEPEQITLKDKIVRAMGFEPAEIADRKGAARSFYRIEGRRIEQRTELMKEFGTAFVERDMAGRQQALREIQKFNRANPGKGITRNGLVASVKSRVRSQQAVSQYGVNAQRGQRQLASELAEEY